MKMNFQPITIPALIYPEREMLVGLVVVMPAMKMSRAPLGTNRGAERDMVPLA